MGLSDNIRRIREERRMTQAELAKLLGVSNKAISTWEHGSREPNMGMIQKMADVWGVKKSFLIDGPSNDPKPIVEKIPILGRVVAGIPLEAIENIEGWEEIDRRKFPSGTFYGLRIKGNSMEPALKENDIVIVKKTEDVDSGSVAIVLIGTEATCKQIKKTPSGIVLIGFNAAAYSPHFYSNEEIKSIPIIIDGKVVESRRTW